MSFLSNEETLLLIAIACSIDAYFNPNQHMRVCQNHSNLITNIYTTCTSSHLIHAKTPTQCNPLSSPLPLIVFVYTTPLHNLAIVSLPAQA